MLKHLSDPRWMKCSLTPRNTLCLPAGRLSYPHLLKAKAMPGEPAETAKFSTSLMLPDGCNLDLAVKMVTDVIVAKWGPNATKVRKPFLRHAEKNEDKELTDAFPVLLRLSSQTQPGVMFANNEHCTTPQEIYGGRWAAITVNAFAWEHPTGGRGVSLGLNNVLLLDHDDPIQAVRPKPEDEFADLFAQAAGASAGAARNPDSVFGGGAGSAASGNSLFN